jgi:hypothetical protein
MLTKLTNNENIYRWVTGSNVHSTLRRIIVLCVYESNVFNHSCSVAAEVASDRAKEEVQALIESPKLRAVTGFDLASIRWEEDFNRIVGVYKKRALKRKVPSYNSLLSFVCIAELKHVVPSSELEGKHKVTYKELGYILKTIRGLILQAPRGKTIPYSYFLGATYAKKKAKAPKPKFEESTTLMDAFMEGMEYAEKLRVSKSQQKVNNYPEQYKKGTGRTLTRQKLTRIIQLLKKYEFIIITETPKGKLKYGVKSFKCGKALLAMDLE